MLYSEGLQQSFRDGSGKDLSVMTGEEEEKDQDFECPICCDDVRRFERVEVTLFLLK